MKRTVLSVLATTAIILVFGVTPAAGDTGNAALVVKWNGGCHWFLDGLYAQGSIQVVGTKNGKWTLSCKGRVVSGPPLDEAVVGKSTTEESLGLCFTEFGSTHDWQAVFTPSGRASFVCQGGKTR